MTSPATQECLAPTCSRCGALVGQQMQQHHDDWHAYLDFMREALRDSVAQVVHLQLKILEMEGKAP